MGLDPPSPVHMRPPEPDPLPPPCGRHKWMDPKKEDINTKNVLTTQFVAVPGTGFLV